jgi:hypothetical protein
MGTPGNGKLDLARSMPRFGVEDSDLSHLAFR